MSCAFCPKCGYDIRQDQPILLNDFSMFGPGSPLHFQGRAITLTPNENMVVWTLMKAAPAPVAHDIMLNRIDSDAAPDIVSVYVHRIRKKLAIAGAPNIIATAHRHGKRAYAWLLKEGQNARIEIGVDPEPPRSGL